MKTYRLSSASERIAAVAVSGLLVVLMALLLYALRGELLTLILVALAALLVAAGLAFYVANLFRAACTAAPREKTLSVRGFPDETLDLSGAVCVETVSRSSGPAATRTLIFSDADGETVASLPTFFAARQGAQAEPLAMALAGELGLEFKPSLEPWEYDREKRKEHEKEAAQARKEHQKAGFQAFKKKILRRPEAQTPAPGSGEDGSPETEEWASPESDGVNYDALDDEK